VCATCVCQCVCVSVCAKGPPARARRRMRLLRDCHQPKNEIPKHSIPQTPTRNMNPPPPPPLSSGILTAWLHAHAALTHATALDCRQGTIADVLGDMERACLPLCRSAGVFTPNNTTLNP